VIENAKKSCPNARFQAIIKAFAGEPINTTMAPKAQIPLNRSGKRTANPFHYYQLPKRLLKRPHLESGAVRPPKDIRHHLPKISGTRDR